MNSFILCFSQCSFQKLHSNQLPKFGIKTEKRSHLFIYYHPYFRKGRRDILHKVVRKTNSSGQALLAASGESAFPNGDSAGFVDNTPNKTQKNRKKGGNNKKSNEKKRNSPAPQQQTQTSKKQRVDGTQHSDSPMSSYAQHEQPVTNRYLQGTSNPMSSLSTSGNPEYHPYTMQFPANPPPSAPEFTQVPPMQEWGGSEHIAADVQQYGHHVNLHAWPPEAIMRSAMGPITEPAGYPHVSSSVEPASGSQSYAYEQQQVQHMPVYPSNAHGGFPGYHQQELPQVYDAIQAPTAISQRNYYPESASTYQAASDTAAPEEMQSNFSLEFPQSSQQPNPDIEGASNSHPEQQLGNTGQQVSTIGEDFPNKSEFSLKEHMFGRGRSSSVGLRSDSFGGGSLYSEFDQHSLFGRSRRSGSKDRGLAGDDSLVGLNCDATSSAPFEQTGYNRDYDDRDSTASAYALRQASFASSIQAYYQSQNEGHMVTSQPTNTVADMPSHPQRRYPDTHVHSQAIAVQSAGLQHSNTEQSVDTNTQTSQGYSKEEVERLTARIQYLEKVMERYVAADRMTAPPVQTDSTQLRNSIVPDKLQSTLSQGDQSEQAALAAAASEAAMDTAQSGVSSGFASGKLQTNGKEELVNNENVLFENASVDQTAGFEDNSSITSFKERKLSADNHSVGEISLPSLSGYGQYTQTPSKTWGTVVSSTVPEIPKGESQFGESESYLEAGLHTENS